ncbi:hypothetical protein [Bdellovibrio bacteriovorus]|uniref:Uncharacterized protein n=1 Tax=Bdellovibrio bacteriovorus str. Tiberius TaxID=1069642 RepID=K7ZEH9_BDEBC|nr:hypothetical protein [Bdellovibrio bacteriovorus]AFY00482.1 hypothetical protein Bdt_0776 [Bdellovibrio bacteriovorus str. Tiberius]
MDGAKLLVSLVTLLIVNPTLASTDRMEWGTGSSSFKMPKVKDREKLSLLLPSFVVHGIKPTMTASVEMPRKLDGNGAAVITPGVGLEYQTASGVTFLAAMVKDCYDNLAGTFQIGRNYELSDRVSAGWSMGVYARQTPMACEETTFGPYSYRECYELDSYKWKFMGSVNGHSVDVIPMPFAHLTAALYKSRDMQVDLKIMSNVFLNEVGIGIPF